MSVLTLGRLKELLKYEPETGRWLRLVTVCNKAIVGSYAGCERSGDYTLIQIDGKLYRGARLACFYMTGEWPIGDVDHEDTDPSNDRWSNLRPANRTQNNANQGLSVKNTSGLKGVSWHKAAKKWQVKIRIDGKQCFLGLFIDPYLGYLAYCEAASKQHGDFARL